MTLYHWDSSRAPDGDYGRLGRETAHAFAEYAQICFEAFGDRVKHWMTFNENWCTAVLASLGFFWRLDTEPHRGAPSHTRSRLCRKSLSRRWLPGCYRYRE